MISYTLKPEHPEFISQEEVRFTLRIKNASSAPVEIPDPSDDSAEQPTFHITGPAFPDGLDFSRAGIITKPPAPANNRPPRLITIEPNGEKTFTLPLGSVVRPRQTGEYHVTSHLQWKDSDAASEPATFHIVPLEIASVHMGSGVSKMGIGEGNGAFLRRGTDASFLYRFRFLENRPGIRETKVYPSTPPIAVAKDASDVAVPWSNGPFFADLIQWTIWREGRIVRAIANTKQIVSVELPEAPAFLVRPPLKAKGGAIDFLAVSANSTHLTLIRFPDSKDRKAPPVVVWTVPFPAKIETITATLAPESQQSRRHIAFTVQRDNGVEIFHSSYTENGKPEAFASVRTDGGVLVPNAPPAIYIDDAGAAHVGLLALSPVKGSDTLFRCALTETVFKPGATVGEKPALTPLAGNSPKPVAGAIYYEANPAIPFRREVVLQTPEKLVRYSGPLKMIPLSVSGTPTHPILLIPGKQTIYILYFEPEHNFHLEPL